MSTLRAVADALGLAAYLLVMSGGAPEPRRRP
jgi:hypothetical protein